MTTPTYTPSPIDTRAVELPPSLAPLVERLAENVHEEWSLQRIASGWTHGPARDDERKHHPCLVPYAELPEAEKEYDRRSALSTLKAVVALGYRIEPPAAPAELGS